MKCTQCQEEKEDKDFYKSSICYKCTFKNKKTLASLLNEDENKYCKICKEQIPNERLVYWKACYCGIECAKKGKDNHNKNYWLRNLTAPDLEKRLQYGKSK